MMKHTPGPWAVVEVPHTGLIGVQRGDRVLNLDHDQEADACLIAAAPDLFEALQYILNQDGDNYRLDHHSHQIATEAIAKARGNP